MSDKARAELKVDEQTDKQKEEFITTEKVGETQTWQKPISPSSGGTCLNCPRKYMFANRWCIHPKRPAPKPAADLGKIAHRLLQLGPGDEAKKQVTKEVEEKITFCTKKIEDEGDMLGDWAKLANSLTTNLNKALAIVQLFWDKYPAPPNLRSITREKTITVVGDFPSIGKIPLLGRIDDLLEDTNTGDMYVRDPKTTGNPPEAILTGYHYSLACRIYRLLATTEGKKEPSGFILDILQTPGIKLCDKDTKKNPEDPFAAYMERVAKWYKVQGKKSAVSYFIRYNEPMLTPELLTILDYINHFRIVEPLPIHFPRDASRRTCFTFSRPCDYYPLCSTDVGAWPTIIEQQYDVVPPVIERKDTI